MKLGRYKTAGLTFVVITSAVAILTYGTYLLARSRTFQLFGEIVARVDTELPVVALTFDDGPNPWGTDRVLPILRMHGVRATFFLSGGEVTAHPAAARALVDAGHEIGNHSYSHARMVLRSPEFVGQEIESTDAAVRSIGYTGPIHFRAPYSNKLVVLPWYLGRTSRITVSWDVEPESFADVASNAEAIANHVLENARPGSIILLHVMYPHRIESVEALPRILEGLSARGLRFVTVTAQTGQPRGRPLHHRPHDALDQARDGLGTPAIATDHRDELR